LPCGPTSTGTTHLRRRGRDSVTPIVYPFSKVLYLTVDTFMPVRPECGRPTRGGRGRECRARVRGDARYPSAR
jgi:hypothetical protein